MNNFHTPLLILVFFSPWTWTFPLEKVSRMLYPKWKQGIHAGPKKEKKKRGSGQLINTFQYWCDFCLPCQDWVVLSGWPSCNATVSAVHTCLEAWKEPALQYITTTFLLDRKECEQERFSDLLPYFNIFFLPLIFKRSFFLSSTRHSSSKYTHDYLKRTSHWSLKIKFTVCSIPCAGSVT